jgi:hypothetical protein
MESPGSTTGLRVMLVHDRPPTVDFAQTNGQANFELSFLPVRLRSTTVDQVSRKPTSLPAVMLRSLRSKLPVPLNQVNSGGHDFLSASIPINSPGLGRSNISISWEWLDRTPSRSQYGLPLPSSRVTRRSRLHLSIYRQALVFLPPFIMSEGALTRRASTINGRARN